MELRVYCTRYGSGEWASDGESVKKEGVGSNTGGGQRNKEKGRSGLL
jgi:hypothetical protein